MKEIDERFQTFTDKLTFMELKKDIGNSKIHIKKSTPLPVIQDSLLKGVLSGDFNEEISYKVFLEGMFFYLGIGLDLPNKQDYKEIISFNKDFSISFAAGLAVEYVEKEQFDYGMLLLRGIREIDPNFLEARYNLGLCYERFALKNKDDSKVFDLYFEAAKNEMEEIIQLDERYAKAYYKLGYYHRYLGEFLLARIYWEKYLEFETNEFEKEEIRSARLAIYDDSLLEGAIRFIRQNKFSDAIKLMDSIGTQSAAVEYYYAQAYKGEGDYENAYLHYKNSIALDPNNSDIYNDFAALLYAHGKLEEARAVYTEGIDNATPDYKLYFNRGLCELNLGLLPEAYEDIKKAHNINPDDAEVLNQYNALENYMQSEGK